MANRKGLGVSKKYANGTIHETATGRFVVLDRFAEDDEGIPMLEFEWLSGEKEGKKEVNREMNMAASIHKFQTSRGKPTIHTESRTIEDDITFVQKIEQTFDIVSSLTEHLSQDETKMQKIDRTLDMVLNLEGQLEVASSTVIGKLDHVVEEVNEFTGKVDQIFGMMKSNREYVISVGRMMDDMERIVSQQQITIQALTEQIHTLVSHSTMVQQQQETMTKLQASMLMQQEIVKNLIEKIK